jgi:peptide/nickel transport system permease protein
MLRFLLGRLLQALVVLLVVGTLVFILLQFSGDPVAVLAPEGTSQAQLEQIRRNLGLDRPVHVQYLSFLAGAVKGELGYSFQTGQPAMRMVLDRLPATAELVGAALLLAVALGIPMGILAALRRGSLIDRALLFVSVVGISAPSFWIALMLLLVFSVQLGWLPSYGRGTLAHLVLPAFTLALFRVALFTRLVRSSLLEELSLDYVRTATAKGLPLPKVILRHAFRNTLIPLVTIAGLQFGNLLAGAVVTETIFAWPGMNRLALRAMYTLDYPVIISFTLVVALLFTLVNALVDVAYTLIDPRVEYR